MNKLLGILTLLVGLTTANAVTILQPRTTLADGNEVIFFSSQPIGSLAAEANFIGAFLGVPNVWPVGKLEFENNSGKWEQGPYPQINRNSFSITPGFGNDVKEVTITWDFTGVVMPAGTHFKYILVKDGRNMDATQEHFYGLYILNGDFTIEGSLDVRADPGATKGISHISFFLPDGGATAVMLGLGILALAGLRRKS